MRKLKDDLKREENKINRINTYLAKKSPQERARIMKETKVKDILEKAEEQKSKIKSDIRDLTLDQIFGFIADYLDNDPI